MPLKRCIVWFRRNITDMLGKLQPTQANRKLAHISTSDPDDPPLPAHFGSSISDSAEKVSVGDTPACSAAEKVGTHFEQRSNTLVPGHSQCDSAKQVPFGDTLLCSTAEKASNTL